ncbi:hypothetical protein G6F62_002648 [Rhizopus arrhizus]|uniref:DUF1746 domain-containing protein n=1 Tax=Rhizopus oryzae TaxID=64495 RepID=A0A9P6XJ14_RHIOR|nr:hypothetical protein G6F23_002705 [Rhizopus arrhizus]KAG0761576.1 hypothetical protein G6F24_007452 [Rhizopus arrhizus]KAG0788006.1 hypothetical protein G6F21_007515 [Rhizopus arrhizus]KAG0799377.1 hypothetical protein G6F22_003287 [Rhizopus arrhizus]KAG0819960.1 hypothetical protein G6F20_000349 [Rhizopus arrhizus]
MFSSSAQTSSNQIDYNVNSLFWAPRISFQDTDSSAYPSSYFTSEALWKYEYKPVSAVLLRVTDDDDSIVNTVQHLLKYPFINEVYIHNFVPNRPLTVDKLKIDGQVSTPIEILEVKEEELKSLARFTSCATAARLYCYFQDDTFINNYMDSLYTNFLRFPSIIHANSKPSHYEKEMTWRFYNKDIRLHTGYADFRYGAFVPRWKVQTFLTQLGKSGLLKENMREAEHYFSIWMNQYPWLLSNPPHLANGVKATDYDVAYPSALDTYTYDAIRHLQRSLENDQSEAPQDYFDRQEEEPLLPHRDVRSSCANDKCLLFTNLESYVRPEDIHFDYRNITSIEKIEGLYEQASSRTEWGQHSYHNAVDSDPSTCWDTLKAPRKGDYFGLMLVGSLNANTLSLYTTNEFSKPEKQLLVSVLAESESGWIQFSAGWLVCMLLHVTIDPEQPGIIIDFIDNQQPPSTFRLLLLDFIILILQVIRVLVTSSLSSQLLLHGTVVTTLAVPPALATAFGADTVTVMLPSRERRTASGEDLNSAEELLYHNELVVDIGLRSCLRNIMYAEVEDGNAARDGSDSLPV